MQQAQSRTPPSHARAVPRFSVRAGATPRREPPLVHEAGDAPLLTETFRVLDAVAALAATLIGVSLRAESLALPEAPPAPWATSLVVGAAALVWPVVAVLLGLYDRVGTRRPGAEARVAAAASAVAALVVLALSWLVGLHVPASTALAIWLSTAAAAVGVRAVGRTAARRLRARGSRRIVTVGSGLYALALSRELCTPAESPYRLVGFVPVDADRAIDEISRQSLGTLDDLEQILMRTPADEVLVALSARTHFNEIERVLDVCARMGIPCKLPAEVLDWDLARPRIDDGRRPPLVSLQAVEHDARYLVKRSIDFVGALAGLLLLSPFLLLVAVAIRLSSPGPALFVQDRYGYRRRRFRMYKFRTMIDGAEELQPDLEHLNEATGPVFKIRRDPRVTPLGRFLRRYSIDEVPQLINVLRGEMSLVGPRPLALRDVHLFDESWPMRRFSVLPGMTCLWQVSGRSDLSFDDWMRLDLRYIDDWSLTLDARIALRTVRAVLRPAGAV